MKKSLFLLVSILVGGFTTGRACTNLIVGKKASADGSVIVTYNADDYGMFGYLHYLPAAKHAAGSMRKIIDGDTHHFHGQIPEVAETYRVVGNVNQYQVSICETTFGGRLELMDSTGTIDYVSLMAIGLQRAKTAREAIDVMTSLSNKYGYNSEGETFTVADKNEAWILEMIGKGPGSKGTVWVAVRVPDDCICAHANQSRIHKFNMKDKKNVLFAKDVITFARKKGYFSGKDQDFDFANTYCPAGFGELRYCEARVWSFFNKWTDGMDKYLKLVLGTSKEKCEPMPLFVQPKTKLSLQDVMNSMRDHYEGTPLELTNDIACGPYNAPYRPTPLSWECDGKKYFNERPISTQQTGYTLVAQLRAWLPGEIGGIEWFGCDDPNMIPYTPLYCCLETVPECFRDGVGSSVQFSWKSAFWVFNWVSNMTYPRYSQLFPSLEAKRKEIESANLNQQEALEQKAMEYYKKDPASVAHFLSEYSVNKAQLALDQWKQLGEYLIIKYNDQTIKPETNGVFDKTKDGLAVPPVRPGYPMEYRRAIIKATGDKYLMPGQ